MFEQIDTYFQGKLSADDKKAFEERLDTDPAFAEDVAFYVASKATLQEQNLRKRHAEWLPNRERSKRTVIYTRMTMGIAASLVLLMFGWLLLKKPELTPEQMASVYIEENLMNLPVKMDETQDSLELGKRFYNEKKYPEALSVFRQLIDNEPQALEFTGLTTLQMNQFGEAITYFERLSQNTELISNKGKFYLALTYLKQGNTQKGRQILQEVITQNLAGKKDAEAFLK
ncbi:MAG: tetratricopeptide repeat protein [Arcicella sp.]|nr:tetratricopeptide repeat protein [Arcicella sp.]